MLSLSALLLASAAYAAQPFLNEAGTGLQTFLSAGNWTEGTLPPLQDMRALPDFDFAARQVLTNNQYAFYRLAAGQEWSYRNNLDVWKKVQFRPRFMRGVSDFNTSSMGMELLGYNFSAPFFIAPAANAAFGDPERAELNYMEAAGDANILYCPALLAKKTIEELDAVKRNDTLNGRQVIFQQLYTINNLSVTWENLRRAEAAGAKAIILTIDTPGSSVRIRAARYTGSAPSTANTRPIDWDVFSQFKSRTNLPIILKGIETVEDAIEAVERGADALYISNHGGRQLEFSPAPVEVAFEIYKYAPEVFKQVPVMADSGIRSGSDVLKLLALGVRAVGLGRSFHYANVYGYDGVARAIELMKAEILQDGWNLGINSLEDLHPGLLNLRTLSNEVRLLEKGEGGQLVQTL